MPIGGFSPPAKGYAALIMTGRRLGRMRASTSLLLFDQEFQEKFKMSEMFIFR
jgi:hypothetical protein